MTRSLLKNVLAIGAVFCTVTFNPNTANATTVCGENFSAPFNVNLVIIAPNLPRSFGDITVKNLTSVINYERVFDFNSRCTLPPGGNLMVIKEAQGELLVKLSANLIGPGYWCPNGTLSLMTREHFQKLYKCNAFVAAEEAAKAKRIQAEKDKIRAMLAK